jgi:negative regulator of sigma E activity
MSHPNHEEWLPYLEGEASPEAAKKLSEHLKACPQCAAEMEARRRTIQKLQRLAWPQSRRATPSWIAPALKWGVAAAVVLGIGFGFGRLSAPNARQMETEVATQVRGELRQEMRSDLLAAFGSDSQTGKDNFRRQLAQEIEQCSAKGRAEERQALTELFNRLHQEQATDYVLLRKDLETLASTADARIQQTRRQLAFMEANGEPINNNP